MIIEYSHNKIYWTKKNKIHGTCKFFKPIYTIKCDKCGKEFEENSLIFEKRLKDIKKEYCGKCARPLQSRRATLIGIYDEDGNIKPNKGRFSTERVESMSKDEYTVFCEQKRSAVLELHKKLNGSDNLKKLHYQKIFKNSMVGYISKAQKDIYEILKGDGYELEVQIGGCVVDILNPTTKIAIEYNGDLWHANPRKYKPKDYIEVIKMTAEEKWAKDRNRRFFLRSRGYEVITIWEHEWINNTDIVLNKLKYLVSDGYKIPKWYDVATNIKQKQLSNKQLNKNKYVPLKEVDEYLKNGWEYGFIKRKGTKWNSYESRKLKKKENTGI